MSSTQLGYFLIADITGYSTYLSQSELEHAQKTLSALLNLLISHTRPPLIISRLAGDAVISYGLRDNFYQGQTFVEVIDTTYIAFRRAIELMVLNTTCPCRACKNIKDLDLKFFIHYGAFGIQKLGGHEEMVGAEVNTIHRFLKNKVTKKTGIRAYTLYSEAAIHQLGLEEASRAMTQHRETYENIGKMSVWIRNMHPVWEAGKEQLRVRLTPDQVLMRVDTIINLSPEWIWDYLIQPEHFNVFAGGTKTVIVNRRNGFVAKGTEYQCYHGETYISQTVLEWQPFERILVRVLAPIQIGETYLLIELLLEQVGEATRFSQIFSKAEGSALGRVMADRFFKSLHAAAQEDIDNFGKYVEEVYLQRLSQFPDSPTTIGDSIG